ncbi:MAG TPA: hypothetical protein VHC39_13130 [Rhizomicrobium sp.]|nr:hypothetical protein [Rhizomicrobium sp.]
MSETITPAPALSARFARARTLSRFVATLFALGCLVMLGGVVSGVLFVFFPTTASGVGHGIGFMNGFGVGFGSKRGWSLIAAMVATELTFAPTVLVLYHLCRLFLCFAKGEVFSAQPIAHIRWAGLWQTISFFTGISAIYLLVMSGDRSGLYRLVAATPFFHSLPNVAVRYENAIFIGVPIIIAAYVMEEAQRIAADHAGIV